MSLRVTMLFGGKCFPVILLNLGMKTLSSAAAGGLQSARTLVQDSRIVADIALSHGCAGEVLAGIAYAGRRIDFTQPPQSVNVVFNGVLHETGATVADHFLPQAAAGT